MTRNDVIHLLTFDVKKDKFVYFCGSQWKVKRSKSTKDLEKTTCANCLWKMGLYNKFKSDKKC